VRARLGAGALAAFGSGALTNEKAYLLGKFARVALRTPHVDYNGRFCMSSAAAAQRRAFGLDRGLPFPLEDVARTRVLVLWGSNAADTLPPATQWIEAQRAAGGALVVVDPRATATARAATLHLQPVPGADLALANGLLWMVLDEDLLDRAFIDARTVGFDEVRRVALSYYPARVERLTGVPETKLRTLARLLAREPSAMMLTGRGPEQQSKGVDSVLALINVMLAVGKVGRPHSGYGCLTGQGNGQGGREHGQKADQLPGYRSIDAPEDRAVVAGRWGIDVAALPGKGLSACELVESVERPGGVRALVVFGSNLAVAMPDATATLRRLRALELLVVADSFPNETTALADFVLPVTQWLEEDGTMTNLEGRVLRRRRARPSPPGVRSDLEVLTGLAARLGCAQQFPTADPAAVFRELAALTAGAPADYSGMTWEALDRGAGLFWPCGADGRETRHPFSERFFHSDGRARFIPVEHRDAGEEPDAAYPLYLTTGRCKEHYNSGAQTRGVERLRAARPEPFVEVHPRLAARLGLADEAIVETRRASVRLRVAITPDLRDDTVFVPFHWGGAQAANLLTGDALDPQSRMPEFKLCAARLRPLAGRPS
jgi:assimilatory nitrate reductase catalytic subunit